MSRAVAEAALAGDWFETMDWVVRLCLQGCKKDFQCVQWRHTEFGWSGGWRGGRRDGRRGQWRGQVRSEWDLSGCSVSYVEVKELARFWEKGVEICLHGYGMVVHIQPGLKDGSVAEIGYPAHVASVGKRRRYQAWLVERTMITNDDWR